MRGRSDDVTATVSPCSMILVLAFTVLVSCGREPTDGPHSSANQAKGVGQDPPQEAVWVVDPKDPGSNLPREGRSLFDYLVTEQEGGKITYKVPFPFPALVKKIERQLGTESSRSSFKRVLIPLNRSLQRHAARPEFFKYPRAVMGVDTEPPLQAGFSGMFLKDRLFLGYQEKANIIEVISYNEAAGRFEFQVVRDYRPGGHPKVLYANRAVCTVCHQNQSPIFARPLWDETNANPKIASLLQAQRRDFYQFPVHQGIDVPNALDDATDRANEFSVSQLLWQDGCERGPSLSESIACRADLMRFLLQYRLSGARGFDTRSARYADQFTPHFLKGWEEKWPMGLLIPNPDILNRNPFDFFQSSGPEGMGRVRMVSSDDGRERVTFRSAFEPSVPRPPIATWSGSEGARSVRRVITGLSNFLAETDIQRLDAHLFRHGAASDRHERRYEAACRYTLRHRDRSVERVTFQCTRPSRTVEGSEGGFEMEGAIYLHAGKVARGAIDHLSFSDGDDLTDLSIARGETAGRGSQMAGRLEVVQTPTRLHARRTDGNAIREIAFRADAKGSGAKNEESPDTLYGHATVTVLDDFSVVHHAIDMMARETLAEASDVFARKPFRRAAVMESLSQHLEMPRLQWCCEDDDGMPEAIADVAADQADAGQFPLHDGEGTVPAITSFRQYCAKCHQGEDTFPPNFLHGSPREVQAQVDHCAERIFFRLEMWRLHAPDRPETPMPPANALRRLNMTPEQWATHADLTILKDYVANVLKSSGGALPSVDALITQGYDNLRECLPSSESDLPLVSNVFSKESSLKITSRDLQMAGDQRR